MKSKFLIKTVGITAAAAVTIGVSGFYNHKSEASAKVYSTVKTTVTASNDNTSNKPESEKSKSDSSTIEKDETVYIFTNTKGERQNIIVSNHLKNIENASILKDTTSLSDIENVKGDETFNQNGENMDWQADGADIYYRGTTDKNPPVAVKISYKLDDKEIEPDALLGKSGKVTIRYDYENTAYEIKKINGKKEKLFVPFTFATALTLPENKFDNIKVTNGKVMSGGNNSLILGITFPGLAVSLGLDNKEENFPEYFEVTADVKDFSLNMSVTAAIPDILSDLLDTDKDIKNKLQENIDKLIDGEKELKTGSEKLKNGTAELKNKSTEFSDGVNKIDSASEKLSKGTSELKTGIITLKNGLDSLANGGDKLIEGTDSLETGLDSLRDGTDKLSDGSVKLFSSLETVSGEYSKINAGISALVDKTIEMAGSKQMTELNGKINGYKEKMTALVTIYGSEEKIATNPADWAAYNQMKGAVGAMEAVITSTSANIPSVNGDTVKELTALKDGSAKIDAALKTLAASSGTLKENFTKLSEGANTLLSGCKELKSGIVKFVTGAGKLNSGASTLETGITKLDDGASNLYNGTAKLKGGVKKLLNGIDSLDDGAGRIKDGIETLSSKLSDTDFAEIFDHFDALAKLGKEYTSFTGAEKNKNNSVKFIIKTEEIEDKKE